MSDFARVLKPHLEAHGIEDAQELAIMVRGLGSDVSDDHVVRWLSDELQPITYVDFEYLCIALEMSESEADEMRGAARRDFVLRGEHRRTDQRRFDEIVEGFEGDNG
jgi:hypothetical protein